MHRREVRRNSDRRYSERRRDSHSNSRSRSRHRQMHAQERQEDLDEKCEHNPYAIPLTRPLRYELNAIREEYNTMVSRVNKEFRSKYGEKIKQMHAPLIHQHRKMVATQTPVHLDGCIHRYPDGAIYNIINRECLIRQCTRNHQQKAQDMDKMMHNLITAKSCFDVTKYPFHSLWKNKLDIRAFSAIHEDDHQFYPVTNCSENQMQFAFIDKRLEVLLYDMSKIARVNFIVQFRVYHDYVNKAKDAKLRLKRVKQKRSLAERFEKISTHRRSTIAHVWE
eukprot:29253_1